MLAGFSGTVANTDLPNNPFPTETFLAVTSLHLGVGHRITIDDSIGSGVPQPEFYEAYVMAVGTVSPVTGAASWRSIRYHPADGTWDTGPVPVPEVNLNKGGMVFHAGSTYSVNAGVLRKEKSPLEIKASGSSQGVNFNATLSLFGGRR